ncbi:uncharacterized protein LOC133310330 [Gastrolobium bilobum]|uniref:uncharacterized protein LOC133310330 n=1 Tax=Gastrolobium bilobum TaxID=150636 RepID=UPI002AB174BD|nr:uncharacterized protein LOC133310330 [Gastrolobium bilobum]
MLNSWVHNTIDLQLQPYIQYFNTAKELWEDLKERYSVANIPRLYQLRTSLANIRQDGTKVGTYYTRLRAIWDEIDASKNQPSCTCGAKSVMAIYNSDEAENEKVYQFLMRLDDNQFGALRTQILNYPTFPNLNQAYAAVV